MTVFRACAVEFRKTGNLTDAGICEVTARALEVELRHLFASSVEPTQGQRTFLTDMQSMTTASSAKPRARTVFGSQELLKWLVDALLEGREHVLALREPAELFATDIESVAAADRWVTKIDAGPPKQTTAG